VEESTTDGLIKQKRREDGVTSIGNLFRKYYIEKIAKPY
jgi:hypothetical protein